METVAELDGGTEEGAALADRLVVAGECYGAGTQAVPDHAVAVLVTRAVLGRSPGAAGQCLAGAVEGFNSAGDAELFVCNSAVRDSGVGHGHGHGRVAK